MKKLKILSVFGTRPEAIKMAPPVLEIMHREELESIICVTGQHRELLDSAMDCFGLKADYDLNIMTDDQPLSGLTARALTGIGGVIEKVSPELVLVQGDTTTALAGALAAYYARIPVAHIEAGLRSGNMYSPFPEEQNRRLISSLAALHFAPTEHSAENLRREGIENGVFVTGNTVIDALSRTASGESFESKELQSLDPERELVTLTCHRRENQGETMCGIFSAVRELAEANPKLTFVFPVHPSPGVREPAYKLLGNAENILLTAPLGLKDMHRLISLSRFVMTDSGGLQEEAPALGTPVLLLRSESERPEAIASGGVMLCGTDRENIVKLASMLISDDRLLAKMSASENPYGDGHASERIVDAIIMYLSSH